MEYPFDLNSDAIELNADAAQIRSDVIERRPISEEMANTITHGIGLLLSLIGASILLNAAVLQAEPWIVMGCQIYVATLVAVYAASTLSHAIQEPGLKRTLRTIDQAVIYLLIAGNFTPYALTYASHGNWWLLLAIMWAVALFGFTTKILWEHRVNAVCIVAYVLLGWMPILAAKPIFETAPVGSIIWASLGGLCYMSGTFFLARDDKVPYFHSVWHLLVIAGSFCHYMVVLQYVVPHGM